MKIDLEKWIIDGSIIYKIVNFEKCCDELLADKNIDLINDTYEIDDDIVYIGEDKSQNEDWQIHDYKKYNYCPYSGHPIDLKIINAIDKTEEYNDLLKQEKELLKSINKTDSKKKDKEIRKNLSEVKNKIDDMYRNDSLVQFRKDDD